LNLILFQYFLSWPPQFMNLWMNEGVRRGKQKGNEMKGKTTFCLSLSGMSLIKGASQKPQKKTMKGGS
jgi:hypothetical protein